MPARPPASDLFDPEPTMTHLSLCSCRSQAVSSPGAAEECHPRIHASFTHGESNPWFGFSDRSKLWHSLGWFCWMEKPGATLQASVLPLKALGTRLPLPPVTFSFSLRCPRAAVPKNRSLPCPGAKDRREGGQEPAGLDRPEPSHSGS